VHKEKIVIHIAQKVQFTAKHNAEKLHSLHTEKNTITTANKIDGLTISFESKGNNISLQISEV
jgi:hypothetical protein